MQISQGCTNVPSGMNRLGLLLFFVATISLFHQASSQDNFRPVLTVSPRSMRVDENFRLNSVVLNCTTTDANSPDTDAGTTYVAFNYGNYERRFVLAASTCELYVVQPLDYETTTRFDVGIRVVDLKGERHNRPFTIFVSDINDNAPTCSPYNVLGSMSEDSPLGATIATFDCSDVDTFFGGKIQFEVISGDTDVIDVGLENGVATLQRTVDFDMEKHTFVVAVRVKDRGTPSLSTTASVILDITDVDDNPPVFAQDSYLESTPEDTPVGTTIFRISATDQDEPSSRNSLIVFGFEIAPKPDLLMIDQRTGDLVVKTELDFEVATEITCQVYAYSSNLYSARTTVDVKVLITDVNDGVPVFTMDYYRASIPESAELGDSIVTVEANDPDSGLDGNVTYSVASADFKIEPQTGLVTVDAPLDYEVRTSYLVLLTATDGGSPAKSTVVFLQVSIEPVNEDTPQFTGTFSFETPENAPIGTSVHTAEATDSDFGVDGVIVYTLLTTGVPFSVDSSTGTIRVAFNLDYESQDFYSFLIEAKDKSAVEPRSSTQNYTVDVTNSNDIPVICDAVETHVIPDASLLGHVVASFKCRDPDSVGATFSYNITSGNDGTFEMDDPSNPENLYTVAFPMRNKYNLTIGVSDGVGLTPVRFAVITETQLEFTNLPTSVNVTEGSSGFIFFTLDWCCPFYYARIQIVAGNDENKVVAFTTSGDILLVSAYDRESRDMYQYTFQVFSTSGQVGEGTLTVYVEDSNDNTPEFGSGVFHVNVVESVPVGTTVQQYLATDADLGNFADVSYTIAMGDSGGHFLMDTTGQLIVNASLNFETTPTYTLVLHAADGGIPSLTAPLPPTVITKAMCPPTIPPALPPTSPALTILGGSRVALNGGQIHVQRYAAWGYSSSTTVIVHVVNSDDNPPTLMFVPGESSISVSEDSALGVRLTQLQASDNDTGTSFTYGITAGNTDGAFLIDPGLGVLYLGKILDRERTDSYTLSLTATDQNGVGSIATLTINVTDVNDNDPVFTLPVFQYDVAHNTGPGIKVGDLLVTDLDEGPNADLTVSISRGNVGGEFSLNGREILTTVTTNYESVKRYTFTVKATDAGDPVRTGTAVVVVTVLPSVDMPRFDPNNAEVFITEGILAGYQVFDVNATVLGASEIDGSMEYAIQSAVPPLEFEVKPDTGEILTIAEMDYERYSLYTLVIRAYIRANTSNFDEFTLTVRVINTNDHSPYFAQGYYSLTVSENAAVGNVVDTIVAQDDDLDNGFGIATQSFTGSSDFEMDSTTGVITVSKTLNFLNNNFYVYLLTAFDGGTPAKSAQVSVVIRVEDYNDYTPIVISDTTTSILDSIPAGSEVYHFHATDLDTGVAGMLTYSLDSDSSGGKFSLDPTTGILNTTMILNAVLEPSHILTVRVQDGGSPMLQATTSLNITVVATNYNNNDPSFPGTVANALVPRNAVRGTIVTTARASDLDLGLSGQVVHKAISGNEKGFFLIDSDTGIITTATRLLEAGDSYSLLILARDKGIPSRSSSMTVNIGVTPLTSVTTTFDYAFTVSETAIANTLVGSISVDPDRSVTGYSIDLGNFGDVFSISTNGVGEGDIAIAGGGTLDYEGYPQYSLLISATTDIGTISKVVVISVVDVNDHPPVFPTSTFAFDLSENTPVDTVVKVFSYTDGDTDPANRANVWALVNPGSDLFSIDQSGQLTVSTSPDFETLPSLTFNITVTDTQSPFTVATLTVTVSIVDVEESETVSSSDVTATALISLELPYQSAAGHVVHTLTMGDFGIASSATASEEFMSINAGGPFTIDSSTGAITVVQPSTLENATQYIRWVVGKSTDGGVTTSRMALVRLDTFDLDSHMVVLELAEPLSTVQALLTDFRKRGQLFFPSGQRFGIAQVFDTGTSSRRKLLATQTVAYAYVVSDTSADDINNINQAKSFMSESDILAVLQLNSVDGSPVEGLSDPAFLEVTSVLPYREDNSDETFFMTPGGIAVLVLLGLLVLVAAVITVTCICLGKNKKAKQAVSATSS